MKTGVGYATRDHVFLVLSATAFIARGRPFDDIDAGTGVIRLKAHGFSTKDEDFVTFEVTTGGSLPTGLSAHVAYKVKYIASDLFRIIDPDTGDPITSYAEGGSGWRVVLDTMRRLDYHLDATAAEIDDALIAHEGPLEAPYPPKVVALNARMAGRAMLTSLQFDNPQFRAQAERLFAQEERDEGQLNLWRSGVPLHPRPVDQTPDVADNGPMAQSGRAAVNWTTGRL